VIEVRGEKITITNNIPLVSPPSAGRPIQKMVYEEEKAFADWLIQCSDANLPQSRAQANQKAVMILERTGESPPRRFNTKTGLPSDEWWTGFYHRWPEVKTRRTQAINRGKATLLPEDLECG